MKRGTAQSDRGIARRQQYLMRLVTTVGGLIQRLVIAPLTTMFGKRSHQRNTVAGFFVRIAYWSGYTLLEFPTYLQFYGKHGYEM